MKNPFDVLATAVKELMHTIGEFSDVYAITARLIHYWQQLSHTQRVEFNDRYPNLCREILSLENINDNT